METSSYFAEQYSGKSKKEVFENFYSVMDKIKSAKSTPDWDLLDS
jgi:hypothetical protein